MIGVASVERHAPHRIDQIIPSIIEHDAVSNHTFSAQRLLHEMGFVGDIYASTLGPGVEGRVRPLAEFVPDRDPSHWVMYQCSIGSRAAEIFAMHQGIKLLDYHNITPEDLVKRWLPPLGQEIQLGREQLARLAPQVDYAIADSRFNASELVALGYVHAEVVPVLIETGNIGAAPDEKTLERYAHGRGHSLVFVGQVAPHKAQHDLILAFSRYRELFDQEARLFLVGREMGSAYRHALERLVRELGLDGSVVMTGSVSTGELAAYYELSDAFVCLSDHEGFCAPIIEAMSRRLPVVAYAVSAVPDTVGKGGLLIARKDPDYVACVLHELFDAPGLVAKMEERALDQARLYTLEHAEEVFRETMRRAIAVLS
ncbi:MAG TPA: glycosyltransferase [Acidimicrobiales bacterium]|nr:glycosyltransferase [Acidimicrobiales bacterium]